MIFSHASFVTFTILIIFALCIIFIVKTDCSLRHKILYYYSYIAIRISIYMRQRNQSKMDIIIDNCNYNNL